MVARVGVEPTIAEFMRLAWFIGIRSTPQLPNTIPLFGQIVKPIFKALNIVLFKEISTFVQCMVRGQ